MQTKSFSRSSALGGIFLLVFATAVALNYRFEQSKTYQNHKTLEHSRVAKAPENYGRDHPVPSIKKIDQIADREMLELMLKSYGTKGSLVQRSVGAAEGTRGLDGSTLWPYLGHIDPMCVYVLCGQGITNLGSFSYQQSPFKPTAHTPLQADLIQKQVLRLQAIELLDQAHKRRLKLNLFQLANGIDLANQSPEGACVQQPAKELIDKLAAGLDPNGINTDQFMKTFSQNSCRWGYIDRLVQATKNKNLSGFGAVVEARKWTFFEVDPSSQRYNQWNASGFGHNPDVIEADQTRRALAVAGAIRYQLEHSKEFSNSTAKLSASHGES